MSHSLVPPKAPGSEDVLDDGGGDYVLSDDDDDFEETPDTFPPLFFMPPMWLVISTLVTLILCCLCLFQWNDKLRDWPKGCTAGGVDDSPICFGYQKHEQWYESGLVKLGSIPLISVMFTFFHIWLALWMTFYPIEFFGILQIPHTNVGMPGWQGIIPSKGEKMARKSVQLMTSQLIDVKKEFSKIDQGRFAEVVEDELFKNLRHVTDSVYSKHFPKIWGAMPEHIKRELVVQAHRQTRPCIEGIMHDLKENILQVFDIEEFVVAFFMQNKDLLCRMFFRCGRKELIFIRNSGATMGGIFGLLQMVIWVFWHPAKDVPLHPDVHAFVVFPVIGLVVGTLTNWIALKIIFEPVDPIPLCCGWKLHGLFLRRQREVSREYGRIVAGEVLTAKNIIDTMLHGPNADVTADLLVRRITMCLDKHAALSKPLLDLALGQDTFDEIKREVTDHVLGTVPAIMEQAEDFLEQSLDMQTTLRRQMTLLSSKEFEGLLHPVFQEDEWKLVVMGGALGVVVGLVQAYFIN